MLELKDLEALKSDHWTIEYLELKASVLPHSTLPFYTQFGHRKLFFAFLTTFLSGFCIYNKELSKVKYFQKFKV